MRNIIEIEQSLNVSYYRDIDIKRPYNVEKRRLKSMVNFGVLSRYFADSCLVEFKEKEHRSALIMNLGEFIIWRGKK